MVELRCGDYLARIDPTRGANCIALRHIGYGAKILREPPQDGEWDNPYLYGMPILFPVNRISGGSFTHGGQVYRFPINEPSTGCHLHGTLHNTAFSVRERSETRLCCVFRATEKQPYLGFPQEFEIGMEYSLGEDGLTHITTVCNRGTQPLPCMLGFHTTFLTHFVGGDGPVLARVGLSEEYARGKDYLPTGEKPLPDAVTNKLRQGRFDPLSQPISRHYRAEGDTVLSLTDLSRGLSVVYENDAAFRFRLIYNGAADEYICLEPQTCLANAPNAPFAQTENGLFAIPAGEARVFHSKISIREVTV